MHLRPFKTLVVKYLTLNLSTFLLLTVIDMLLKIEKSIGGAIWHAIHRFVKANNKYMKYYDKSRESTYLKYWDINNLYGWGMSQNLTVNGFK